MPATSTAARKAVEILLQSRTEDRATTRDRDDFIATMRETGLPFIGISFADDIEAVDLVLFSDGSGIFADADDGEWLPWALNVHSGQVQDDEFIPTWDKATEVMDFSTPYTFPDTPARDEVAYAAWLKTVARDYPDPPEALRKLIVDPERAFDWQEPAEATLVTERIAQIALLLCPEAREISIHADAREGVTPTEKRSNEQMMKFLAAALPARGEDATMDLFYRRIPYAEILEAGSDYEAAQRANQVLGPISAAILKQRGTPVGWETQYNDGATLRMSGYSAYPATEHLELDELSAHARVSALHAVRGFLEDLDLLDMFATLLAKNGFPPLTGKTENDE